MTRVLSVLTSVLAVAAVSVGVAVASDYGNGYGSQDYGSGDRAGKKKSGGQNKSSKAWRQYKDLEKTNAAHSAYLTGKALGGKGDPDAKGSAIFHYVSPTTICYGFTLKGAGTPQPPVGIHKGKPGQSSPVPVIMFANVPKGKDGMANGNPGASSGCKDLLPNEIAALAKIQAKPENYYVRMSTNEFTGGAVRGQLSKVRFDND